MANLANRASGIVGSLPALLREHWGLTNLSLRPSVQGVNNLTALADTSAGRFVVKVRSAAGSLAYEHSVLKHLASRNLPFSIPVPLATRAGGTWTEADGFAVALTPWIDGGTPEDANLEHAGACGRALGQLDSALADLPFERPPSASEPSEDLARLPRQVIHRDFDPSNVLMDGSRVSGILDFEFCGGDLRVLDLTYALSQWPGSLRDSGKEWQVIGALAAGFRSAVALTEAEIEAIPTVLRRRWADTLVFRRERVARGLVPEAEFLAEAADLSEAELWLRRNESKLKACVRGE